jgi:hypothetical protein
LPPRLRPNWFIRIGLVLGGIYFFTLGVITVLDRTHLLDAILKSFE